MKVFGFIGGLMIVIAGCAVDSWRSPFRPGKSVVEIGGQVRILTHGTSCKVENWDWGKRSNANAFMCQCCLVKESLRGNGRFQIDGNQINFCKNKGQCADRSIRSLKSVYELNPAVSDIDFMKKIIDKSQQTESVATQDPITENEGKQIENLSPDGVRIALEALNLLDLQKQYTVSKFGAGGANTLQLFGVFEKKETDKKLIYIVKGLSKAHEETKNLRLIQKSFLSWYSTEEDKRPKGVPALALNVKNFKYYDQKGHVHYIAVLIAAPGNPLFEFTKKYTQSVKQNKSSDAFSRAQNAFSQVGEQMARFHLGPDPKDDWIQFDDFPHGMVIDENGRLTGYSRAIHGDFHTNNVFYDSATGQVTLIDIETMALALKKPRSIGVDLLRFYIYSTLHINDQHNATKGLSMRDWHHNFIKPFLKEYVRVYVMTESGAVNADRLSQIMRILRGIYLKPLTNPGDFVRTGLKSYYMMQKKYLAPILMEIEESFRNQREQWL